MFKFLSATIYLLLALSLAACGGAPVSAGPTEIAPTGEPGGEITVCAYDTMTYRPFLEEAARLFEQKYPGTTVNIETFSAMPEIKSGGGMVMMEYQDDPQGRQDYINTVNTALMSGGGADILALDVLPFYRYANSGQLENLTAYMQADPAFNRDDYRANILDAAQYQSGVWFLPLDYTFNYYTYDSAVLTDGAALGFGLGEKFSAQELIALAAANFDGSAMIFNRPDYSKTPRPDLWSLLLAENYASFMDIENKQAHFDDGGFAALLESVRQYSERGYIPQGATAQSDAEAMMPRAGEGPDERCFFKPQNVINLFALYSRGLGMSMTAMAEGGTMAIGDNDQIAGIAACANGGIPFTYSQAYGINANSKNKETAWAFLRFLLSEDIQGSALLPPTALPVLNSARENKMTDMLGGMMGEQEQSLNQAQAEAIANYNQAVEALSGQINAYTVRDTVIDDMINAEVQYFFDGLKSAAEVAATLQNKAELYLNE